MSDLSNYGNRKIVLISILFGILSLALSPYGFKVVLGDIILNIPWSIILPILISLSFGWKYGIVAGFSGGAYFPFLLWSNDGWANLVTSFLYLLIYGLIGLIYDSRYFKKIQNIPARFIMVFAICIFILLSYEGLFFNFLLHLNPPFWQANSIRRLPPDVLWGFALKDCINLVYLVLISETLLKLPGLRRFLGVPLKPEFKPNNRILLITISAFLLIWLSFIGLATALLKGSNALHIETMALSFIVIVSSGFLTARALILFNLTQIEIQNKLNKSNEKFKSIFDLSFGFIGLLTADGKVIESNSSALEFAGIKLSDIDGKYFWETPWWSHSAEMQNLIREAVATASKGTLVRTEVTHLSKDGKSHIIDFSLKPIRDEAGNINLLIPEGRDITQSRQAEIEINESRTLITSIINSTSDLIWSCKSEDFSLTTFNLAFSNHFFRTRGIIIKTGLLPEDILPPEFAKDWREYYNRTLDNGPYSVEYRTHDGSLILELNFNLLKRDGIVFGISVFGKDISERKQAEEALIESEERFRNLSDLLPQAIFETDMDGNLTYVNKFGFKLFGYAQEEINKGIKAYNLLVPEDITKAKGKVKLILSENSSSKSEYTAIRKDGMEFPAIIYSNAINVNGKPVGLRGIIFDLTDIKQAEEEVRKLFHIIEQSPVSILITDPNGIIEYANPRFTDITGYAQDEVRGKSPGILKSGQTTEQEYIEMWTTIKNGKDWKGEFYNKKKNGEFYWEAAWISPVINEKGQITHFISADEDITEKKESDRQILHAIIEAEENERNRFSRELHDGLGPIMSTAKLYFQWLADNTNPLEKIRIVEKGNNCINDAIQSLREISNNLSPRVLSNLGVVAAIQNFINLLNETEKLIVDFHYNIEERFEKNLEITIYRVSTELINNTLKYAQTTTAGLSLNYLPEDSQIVLDYFDEGKGFDLKEALNSRKGHGLLNIQQRVKTLNGKVIMKASPGIGVNVHIELPIEAGLIESMQ